MGIIGGNGLIQQVLRKHNLDHICYLGPSEREALAHILDADQYVDTIIPRGSQGLIQYVREHSWVPVIETGAGIVHTYFDESGDVEKGAKIVAVGDHAGGISNDQGLDIAYSIGK